MKRTLILFSIFLALVLVYVEALGQTPDVTEALCALNEQAPTVAPKFSVPLGAQHRKETVWRQTPPEGFGAVLALMQVTNVLPCPLTQNQESAVTIRAFRLIEQNQATGKQTVVSEVTDFREKSGMHFDGRLFERVPQWYPQGGAATNPAPGLLAFDGPALVINPSQAPRQLFHGWTDPKVAAKPGMNYLVEMEVKISGLARLQMGIDYWREIGSAYNEFDQTCQKSNNCEGYLSNWFGPTDDWQTIRVPRALTR